MSTDYQDPNSNFPPEPDAHAMSADPDGVPPSAAEILNTRKWKKRVFLKAFCETAIIADGCTAARVTRKTVFGWVERDLKFRERFLMAQEEGADRVEKELFQRAMIGDDAPIIDKKTGMVVGTYKKKSDMLLVLLLKGMRPLKYKERVDGDTKDKLNQIQDELKRLGVIKDQQTVDAQGAAKVLKVEDAMLLPAPVEDAVLAAPPQPIPEGVDGDGMPLCTWAVDKVRCSARGTAPQEAPDGRWAILCEAHDAELTSALTSADPKAVLSCWVKAQGGAEKAFERVFGEPAPGTE